MCFDRLFYRKNLNFFLINCNHQVEDTNNKAYSGPGPSGDKFIYRDVGPHREQVFRCWFVFSKNPHRKPPDQAETLIKRRKTMSIQHFKSLLFRSAKIQEEIEKEHRRPWPNWMRLLKLKKIRLAIKDRMERLAHQQQSGKLQPVRLKSGRQSNDNWQGA